jgi:hypothetical protein
LTCSLAGAVDPEKDMGPWMKGYLLKSMLIITDLDLSV